MSNGRKANMQASGKHMVVVANGIRSLGTSLTDVLESVSNSVKGGQTVQLSGNNTVYGAVADIESYLKGLEDARSLYLELVSSVTKEALYRKRKEGATLGRPVGSNMKTRILMANVKKVIYMIDTGATREQICRRYGVSISTLYRFLKAIGKDKDKNLCKK